MVFYLGLVTAALSSAHFFKTPNKPKEIGRGLRAFFDRGDYIDYLYSSDPPYPHFSVLPDNTRQHNTKTRQDKTRQDQKTRRLKKLTSASRLFFKHLVFWSFLVLSCLVLPWFGKREKAKYKGKELPLSLLKSFNLLFQLRHSHSSTV